MGTLVGFSSPDPLPPEALAQALRELHEADRIFSTWKPDSAISRLRSDRAHLDELEAGERDRVLEVLARCAVARELSGGVFDPWALPGGFDPTGLVKGWAVMRALRALTEGGSTRLLVNAGGDIAVAGSPGDGEPWRVGVRHPEHPEALVAIVEIRSAVATSGDYERPGQLVDPSSGRIVSGVAATVTGPELDLADALATALSVAGPDLLPKVDQLAGYEGFVITPDGRRYATPGMRFAS